MNSPFNWVGGKSKLVSTLIHLIPVHTCYVEVFGGAGWLLFGKNPLLSKHEVINDFDNSLVNLYRVVKDKPDELIKDFDFLLNSRGIFNEYKEAYKDPDKWASYSDVERARMFYYMIKASFGADMTGLSFGTGIETGSRINFDRLGELKKAHTRLKRVTVDNRDFRQVIDTYDSEVTFFYLDPPYYKTKSYNVPFTLKDQEGLRDMLKKIKGKFLLSLNDCPEVRELYKDFDFVSFSIKYCINANVEEVKTSREVLVTNIDYSDNLMWQSLKRGTV